MCKGRDIYVRQPAARGHRAFTDLSAARVRGQSIMHSLQPSQLGIDSLLNMVPIPPLGQCVEGPSFGSPLGEILSEAADKLHCYVQACIQVL